LERWSILWFLRRAEGSGGGVRRDRRGRNWGDRLWRRGWCFRSLLRFSCCLSWWGNKGKSRRGLERKWNWDRLEMCANVSDFYWRNNQKIWESCGIWVVHYWWPQLLVQSVSYVVTHHISNSVSITEWWALVISINLHYNIWGDGETDGLSALPWRSSSLKSRYRPWWPRTERWSAWGSWSDGPRSSLLRHPFLYIPPPQWVYFCSQMHRSLPRP
jgi:hypothetical protein